MSDNKIISIRNLYSVYSENEDNQFVALNNINYDFYENKIYCIIGNSGSGKSTLVNHFNGLIPTKYGKVSVIPSVLNLNNELNKIKVVRIANSLVSSLLSVYESDAIFMFNTNDINAAQAKNLIQVIARNQIAKIKEIKILNKLVSSFNKQQLQELDLKILKINSDYKKDLELCKNNSKQTINQIDRILIKKIKDLVSKQNTHDNLKHKYFIVKFKEQDLKNPKFQAISSFSSLKDIQSINITNKTTKKDLKTLDSIELGFNWNIHQSLIGILQHPEIRLPYNYDEIIVFKSNNINKKLAKILIEGHYNIKLSSIKTIDKISCLRLRIADKQAFAIRVNKNIENLKSIKRFTANEINKIKENIKVTKPNFFQKRKLKKIKKFKRLRKEIGMVFQFPEYQLFKDTIEKDIMFGPRILGIPKQECKTRAKYYLNKLGMGDEFLPRNPFGLSGGQKRRVAIAGILSIETPVLIFDEPTAGLDPVGEQEMMQLILDCKKQNRTIFMITHTMDHVLEVADEIIVLHNGEIINHGTPYEIFFNDQIINQTSIQTPKVIQTIKDLIECNDKYKKLIDFKPRTTEQLAEAILKVRKE